MKVLPNIEKVKITRSDIYEEYVKRYTEREFEKLDLQPKEKKEIV